MNNKIKFIVLLALIVVVCVELVLLMKTNNEIKEIEEAIKITDPEEELPTEPPVAPLVTINSDIDLSSFQDSVVASAVNVARELVNEQIKNNVYLSDAMVFDIVPIDVQTDSTYDSYNMFRVDVVLSANDGQRISDNSTYLVYYNRWDEDEKGTYFLSSVKESTINEKYESLSESYDNKYVAACETEKLAFLKKQIILEEDLYSSACNKANAFAKSLGIDDVIVDAYTMANEAGSRMYMFSNSENDTCITITYIFFEDELGWSFLSATCKPQDKILPE